MTVIEQVMNLPYFLPTIFFIVALIYSSVGLGGGSSYTALMALSGMSVLAIPMVSLTLNIIVTTIGSYNFLRNGHGRIRLITPFLISSIPMAYLGGAIKVSPEIFHWILLISLIFVVVRIYFWRETRLSNELTAKAKLSISIVAGSILGLISGIVGIGGGVYLVPLILILGLGSQKEAAACGAIFIWLNSVSGLASRLQYNSVNVYEYIPMIVAVVLGGAIGSFMGSSKMSPQSMEKALGLVVVIAVVFLSRKLLF